MQAIIDDFLKNMALFSESGLATSSSDRAAPAGVRVAISIRKGANFVPLTLLGIPIQYYSRWMQALPRLVREDIASAGTTAVECLRGGPVIQKPRYGPLEKQL